MLDQAKVDLAVLLKVFQHSEADGGAQTPQQMRELFQISIPTRRIELALQTLQERNEVEREYQPNCADQGLWHISRDGVRTVEKALKLPNSFIHRLSVGGDIWLESDEAHRAVLGKNARYAVPDIAAQLESAPSSAGSATGVSINVAPVITVANGGADSALQRSSHRSGWIGAWAGIISVTVAIVALYFTLRG